ncbi:cobalamin-dependent protein [Streptomyces sp. MJP52]|uniref:cobalamin B12-binding domain-containing protein n=1 Tax=Streptomyces sp. MJP52 TaxID=2940555 RepID=UPI002475EE77|nr:cobalamin-dependent protein [Streptomyces sp. MJP52]MDH6224442.1 methanogenic corrinoid protein MtbC1 [Streptomyces sp. MJP52]
MTTSHRPETGTEPSTEPGPGAPVVTEEVHERLWAALRDGDEYTASGVVMDAVEAGASVEEVLLDLIAPVQVRIGAEWAANRITVAQEHSATAVNERVMAALAHHPGHRPPPPRLGRITVACVDGEWHALPARLVSEVLRRRGWEVGFLGAHVPTPHLVAELHATAPRAVALSCSMPRHLPVAHRVIAACQAAGFPVLAGGRAFGPDGRHARALGADGWAPNARGAAEVLASGLAGSLPRPAHLPVEDLPHLADHEYAAVTRARQRLVREVLAGLEERFPPMRSYTDEQRDRTAEDVAHVVDHLVAALYVDDDVLFTGFITWTAEVLTARGVPAASLDPTLDLLTAGLPAAAPRARRVLAAGRAELAAAG